MRKSILYLFLLLAIPSMAQYRGHGGHGPGGGHEMTSTLTIVAPKNQAFWLFVDDVLQNENAVQSIRINKIRPDELYVRVELDNENQDCVGRFIDLRHSRSFNIVQRGNLMGLEPTQVNIRPELVMDLVTEVPLPPMPPTPPAPQVGPGQPPMPVPPHGETGMNAKDFYEAISMLSAQSFDDTRLSMAEQIIASNPMTVDQISQICKLFSFESNRLEWAKFAYPYCINKNEYHLLNETFTFNSSKQELMEYIRGL